jgi:hypothetical protein
LSTLVKFTSVTVAVPPIGYACDDDEEEEKEEKLVVVENDNAKNDC